MMSTPADEYATDLTDAQWRLICIRGSICVVRQAFFMLLGYGVRPKGFVAGQWR